MLIHILYIKAFLKDIFSKVGDDPMSNDITAYNEDYYGMGWIRDYPDIRDYHPSHSLIQPMVAAIGIPNNTQIPGSVDLRKFCSPVKHQGKIGSCTSNAAGSLVEYFENKAFGKYTDASRLFLYKVARNLLGWQGDTGAYCRTVLGTLTIFGVPPEKYWPYDVSKYDVEPTAFCYSFAQNYQTTKYFRLDTPNLSTGDLLKTIKEYLSVGIPFMFGFTLYSSYKQATSTGMIPYPGTNESVAGAHCVMAVGFDDKITITNSQSGSATTGAILIKNSWGTGWGAGGYGWLPYDYVTNGIVGDCWCILNNEWIDTGAFGE